MDGRYPRLGVDLDDIAVMGMRAWVDHQGSRRLVPLVGYATGLFDRYLRRT